ncbi:putative 3-ketoacyl-CoA thiolase [Taphrina deformans PYCC 5710]|uniref:3-ketoacyl-CoA thiolase n=1 Tax=Taphrina deformans (strain PYCC 5710 / ATCC 11124 / CBS 356.35 / IMI 108563 / JCM 9778 / NBRC 8474) TaxID=1097556 RepID=R4XC77_TAPDE|nr:putative 3-ketoacyl-CoA thiolase [Taphrina deformans PYCC 5710]|eukprot:CCG81981.1 putative 3-ketoacyl-CoA thiolase [Taphrina deformans PYCC 5710]
MSFTKGIKSILRRNADDVVIVSAIRTPITKAKKGGLAKSYPEELLAAIVKQTLKLTAIDPRYIEDVAVGTVLQALGGQKTSAMAIKYAGLPHTSTLHTVNRQCSSSAQAVTNIAQGIFSKQLACGLAAGVESMTMDYFETRGIPNRTSPMIASSTVQEALDVLMPMGRTSENVSQEYNISRADQDEFALASHMKAHAAQKNNWFTEIVPIEVQETATSATTVVDRDDGVRSSLTLDKLASLPPAFGKGGLTTAGNASQISDGASAILLMSRQRASELGLKPIGKFVNSTVAGVPSNIMGIAPALAVPKLLSLTGLGKNDIDLWELNEAFASQSLHVIRQLDLDMNRINVHGGAIALGHPLGATGGRCIATLLASMARLGKELGIVSMCASTGQGYAALFVNEVFE